MDRELELQKIQTIDNYFQAWFSMISSILVSGFIGFLIILVTLRLEEVITPLTYVASLAIIFVVLGVYGLSIMNKRYNEFLRTVDGLLVKLDKGESLPSIMELKKKKWY